MIYYTYIILIPVKIIPINRNESVLCVLVFWIFITVTAPVIYCQLTLMNVPSGTQHFPMSLWSILFFFPFLVLNCRMQLARITLEELLVGDPYYVSPVCITLNVSFSLLLVRGIVSYFANVSALLCCWQLLNVHYQHK